MTMVFHWVLGEVLLEQARQFSVEGEDKQLRLAVSDHFRSEKNVADWQRWKHDATVDILESTGDGDRHRDPSLAVL